MAQPTIAAPSGGRIERDTLTPEERSLIASGLSRAGRDYARLAEEAEKAGGDVEFWQDRRQRLEALYERLTDGVVDVAVRRMVPTS